jgi:uncharacterized protein YjbI with pentapeptide repeats
LQITPPRIAAALNPVDSFAEYACAYLRDDTTIEGIQTGKEQCEGADFYKLDVRGSVFAYGTCHKCSFEKASFIDVLFQACDFSNSNFQGAYFQRCKFVSCKCVGADMAGAFCKDTIFEDTNLRYANFNTAKFNGVQFDHVDFTEASMAEAKLARFTAEESKFIRNDFSKTLLKGVDFSSNEFIAPTVSIPPVELRGISIDMFQAADLVGLLGVKIKQRTPEKE